MSHTKVENFRTKIVRNIQQAIYGEEVGNMVVVFDLAATEVPNPTPEEERSFFEPDIEENRTIRKIHLVELHLFDKVGLDITRQVRSNSIAENMLKGKLLSEISLKTLSELGAVEEEDKCLSEATAFVHARGGAV